MLQREIESWIGKSGVQFRLTSTTGGANAEEKRRPFVALAWNRRRALGSRRIVALGVGAAAGTELRNAAGARPGRARRVAGRGRAASRPRLRRTRLLHGRGQSIPGDRFGLRPDLGPGRL